MIRTTIGTIGFVVALLGAISARAELIVSVVNQDRDAPRVQQDFWIDVVSGQ
jgi:hypothetical protein